jgi:hypothetical protein
LELSFFNSTLKSKSRMMMMIPQPLMLLFKLEKQSKQIQTHPLQQKSQLQQKMLLPLKPQLRRQLPKQKRLSQLQLPLPPQPLKNQQQMRRPKPPLIILNCRLPLKMPMPIVSRELSLSLLLFKLKWMPISRLLMTEEKRRLKVSTCKVIDQKINSRV